MNDLIKLDVEALALHEKQFTHLENRLAYVDLLFAGAKMLVGRAKTPSLAPRGDPQDAGSVDFAMDGKKSTTNAFMGVAGAETKVACDELDEHEML